MQRIAEQQQRRLEQERMEAEEGMRRRIEQDRLGKERQERERNLELQRRKEEEDRAAAEATEAAIERLEALQREARRLENERWKEEDRQARHLEVQRRELERRRAENREKELREARRAEARVRRLERRAARREEAKRLEKEAEIASQQLRDALDRAPVESPNDPQFKSGLHHFPSMDDGFDVYEKADAQDPPYAESQSFKPHDVSRLDVGERATIVPSISPDTHSFPAQPFNAYTQPFFSAAAPPTQYLDIAPISESRPLAEEQYQPPVWHLYSHQDQLQTPAQGVSHGRKDVETMPNIPGYFPMDDHEYDDAYSSAAATPASETTWATTQPQTFSRPAGRLDAQLRGPGSTERMGSTHTRAPGNVSIQTQVPPGPYFSRASASTPSRRSTNSSLVDSGYHAQSSSGSGSGSSGSRNKRSSAFGKLFGSRR